MREAGRGRSGRGRMQQEDAMKGVIGCDGVDSPEMISRCLSCTKEVCLGEESCARGYKPLITVPVGQGRIKGYAARLAAAGMNVKEIAKKLNRTQREIASWL